MCLFAFRVFRRALSCLSFPPSVSQAHPHYHHRAKFSEAGTTREAEFAFLALHDLAKGTEGNSDLTFANGGDFSSSLHGNMRTASGAVDAWYDCNFYLYWERCRRKRRFQKAAALVGKAQTTTLRQKAKAEPLAASRHPLMASVSPARSRSRTPSRSVPGVRRRPKSASAASRIRGRKRKKGSKSKRRGKSTARGQLVVSQSLNVIPGLSAKTEGADLSASAPKL